MDEDILKKAVLAAGTPCYIFDTDAFERRVSLVSQAFGDRVRLCYSIKANPFLLRQIPAALSHVEVCSPGELSICEHIGVPLDKIVFSGVNKTKEDIERAYVDGVAVFTAESRRHIRSIDECASAHGRKAGLLLRLSHGSQFGMDTEEIQDVIAHRDSYKGLDIIGLHYFTGTQKSRSGAVLRELEFLDSYCRRLQERYAFDVRRIEYGAGLAVDYYQSPDGDADLALLEEVSAAIRCFGAAHPLTVEMGRFLAAQCGYYLTQVMDIKKNDGIVYAICDGGIHHLVYHGQNMAMKVPPIRVLGKDGAAQGYCLCGSLCTTADVLVRKALLPELAPGDIICFSRCGAYSVSEGISLFLSRALPAVMLYSKRDGMTLARALTETYPFNMP